MAGNLIRGLWREGFIKRHILNQSSGGFEYDNIATTKAHPCCNFGKEFPGGVE